MFVYACACTWVERRGSRDSQMDGQSKASTMTDACERSHDGEQPSHMALSTSIAAHRWWMSVSVSPRTTGKSSGM